MSKPNKWTERRLTATDLATAAEAFLGCETKTDQRIQTWANVVDVAREIVMDAAPENLAAIAPAGTRYHAVELALIHLATLNAKLEQHLQGKVAGIGYTTKGKQHATEGQKLRQQLQDATAHAEAVLGLSEDAPPLMVSKLTDDELEKLKSQGSTGPITLVRESGLYLDGKPIGDEERDSILAGLRLLQHFNNGHTSAEVGTLAIEEVRTNGEEHSGLGNEAIDALCEEINQ